MKLGRSTGASDAGRRRRRNEDVYVHAPPLFAVADGMGGAQAGEVAAKLAAAVLREDTGTGGGEDRVVSLVQEANRRVHQRSSEDAATSGMGTTMTVALVADDLVSIGHVGDSRAYLVRDGRLEQLTEDHSLVAELLRSGKLSPEEAETHPQRSVVTRVLGTEPDVDVDTFAIEPKAGDLFLLCSDGLSTMVDDRAILDIVERHRSDLDRTARALIGAANKAGGEDNITVVAFEITADTSADGAGTLDDTQRIPAASETRDPDEEDTLDELDQVPAVDTMVVPSAEAARRRADAEAGPTRRRRSFLGRLMRVLLVIAFLAAIAALVVWYLTQ